MLPTTGTNRYGDLLKEFYDGIKSGNLPEPRLDEIVRIFNDLWDRESMYRSWMSTPTGKVSLNSLNIAGDIEFNEFGIFFRNQEGLISFQDTNGIYDNLDIYSSADDAMVFKNSVGGGGGGAATGGFVWHVDDAAHYVMQAELIEDDGGTAGILLFRLFPGTNGAKLVLGASGSYDFKLVAPFDTSDSMYISMSGGDGSAAFATPPDPGNNSLLSTAHIYIRNQKLVIQYNDGGTIRYKYLDLTGSGTTWTHTTSAP